ncbi:hypothetical protein SULI_04615 [Saccharolobus solfataricus]|uniref:Uncharacterized protein n=2 Tax=Saccharolobus solfataricus TaxID=2287 RepID=A0A157T683_SACSO|nr:hypothetical protein SULB_03190 [Saccharolobus solfataricus]AYN75749.1 hypothetical protein SULC_03185 [Saccharolobus solfataricus]AYP18584.1 hypothetical protein SULA_03195 [Saccharolobus solfataricus]AZF67757.1 hypothetical protein SULG_04615 [Saccharolobus solfataricus]AZF70377.1 hypothetical protein SULH_04615 [Saccharolobus solfataricus]
MARRTCPKCSKVVEILVEHVKNKVVKKCPNCGYIFIEYEINSNSSELSSLSPSTKSNGEVKEQYRFE